MVDYEPLPVVVDPTRRSRRARRSSARTAARTSRTTTSGTGSPATQAPPTRRSPPPRSGSSEDIYIPRIHVASIETCGCVADWDPVRQQLTLHMTSQAPHAIRTVLALVAAGRACRSRAEHPGQDPRHRRRVRRQGAGLPGLRPRGRRLVPDRQAGQVDRGPLGEPPGRLVRPRLPHPRRDGRDQGRSGSPASRSRPSPTTATPTPRPTRPSSRPACST